MVFVSTSLGRRGGIGFLFGLGFGTGLVGWELKDPAEGGICFLMWAGIKTSISGVGFLEGVWS